MRKSNMAILDELKPKLLQVPALVNSFQQKELAAFDDFVNWLQEGEEALKKFNFSQASELAGLRARLLSLSHNTIKRSERKKVRNATALELIYPAQECIQHITEPIEEKVTQARDIVSRLLAIARNSGISLAPPKGQSFSSYINSFWNGLAANEQLASGVHNANSLVGNVDVMRLVAEEIQFS